MIVSVRHDQREKPNNLKLIQQTKVLIRNQLADKAKARLPTFSHNLHLNIYSISLTFSDIHQKPTCRLFDSIQFCVASFLVTHRIFFVSPSDIPDNRCLTECDFIRENPPSSGQVVDFEQLIRKTPPVYGQTELFESTFYSNRFMVASLTASHRKKLNIQADSQKLVKPISGIARGELRST